MVPPAVAKAIGITVSQLRNYVSMSTELIAAFRIARDSGSSQGVYSRFVGNLSKYVSGITTSTASTIYRAARYFADPGKALAYMPDGAPIDPRLARDLPASGKFAAEIGSYRAMVDITITDPETGKSMVKGIWVKSLYPMTLEEIYEEAASHLDSILSGSPVVAGKTSILDYNIKSEITDFARFV